MLRHAMSIFALTFIGSTANADCLRYGSAVSIADFPNGSITGYLNSSANGAVSFNSIQQPITTYFQVTNADRPGLEGFVYEGDKIALLAIHDKFVVAENTGQINANRLQIGPWEEWTVENQHPTNVPAADIDRNQCINLSGGSGGNNQGFVSLRSNWENFLGRNNSNGNPQLFGSPKRLLLKSVTNLAPFFKIPTHVKNVDFLGDCETKVVPSKYGPQEICVFDQNEIIAIDMNGIAGEDGYHLSLHSFDQQSWTPVGTIFDNGSGLGSHRLVEGHWVCSQCNAPRTLIVNDILPSPFNPTIPPNSTALGNHDGLIYSLSIAAGPTWRVVHLFFDIEAQ